MTEFAEFTETEKYKAFEKDFKELKAKYDVVFETEADGSYVKHTFDFYGEGGSMVEVSVSDFDYPKVEHVRKFK